MAKNIFTVALLLGGLVVPVSGVLAQVVDDARDDLGAEELRTTLADTVGVMRAVQRRLKDKNAAKSTQEMQQDIVREFDRLIGAIAKQPGMQLDPQDAKADNAISGQAMGRDMAQQPRYEATRPSNQAANASRSRPGSVDVERSKSMSREAVMEASWGNLPASVQQQMRSARPEKFLPKYESLIERYYQRLAEESP